MPKDHQIHDLASLVNVDKKNIDAEKLGVEAVKEQQAINLKNSSNETAFIPEDQAQVMLAGVSRMSLKLFTIFSKWCTVKDANDHVRTRTSLVIVK